MLSCSGASCIFGIAYLIFIGLGAGFGLLYRYSTAAALRQCSYSILDIVALLVIMAMVWVIIKRYIIMPERLKREARYRRKDHSSLAYRRHHEPDGALLLDRGLWICRLWYSEFLAASRSRHWLSALVNAGISHDSLVMVYKSLWWLNYVLLLAAVIYAPRSKHLHPSYLVRQYDF